MGVSEETRTSQWQDPILEYFDNSGLGEISFQKCRDGSWKYLTLRTAHGLGKLEKMTEDLESALEKSINNASGLCSFRETIVEIAYSKVCEHDLDIFLRIQSQEQLFEYILQVYQEGNGWKKSYLGHPEISSVERSL